MGKKLILRVEGICMTAVIPPGLTYNVWNDQVFLAEGRALLSVSFEAVAPVKAMEEEEEEEEEQESWEEVVQWDRDSMYLSSEEEDIVPEMDPLTIAAAKSARRHSFFFSDLIEDENEDLVS